MCIEVTVDSCPIVLHLSLVFIFLLLHFKGQNAPLVFDFKSLLKALSGKEAEAQSDLWSIVQKGGRLERHLSTQATSTEA